MPGRFRDQVQQFDMAWGFVAARVALDPLLAQGLREG
jgi:hypothetical protein